MYSKAARRALLSVHCDAFKPTQNYLVYDARWAESNIDLSQDGRLFLASGYRLGGCIGVGVRYGVGDGGNRQKRLINI